MRAILKRVPGLRKVVRLLRGTPMTPREYLLNRMPKKSVCAEIGVFEGAFSESIIRYVNPARLHLIDPWKFGKGDEQYEKALTYLGVQGSDGQMYFDERFEIVKRRLRKEIGLGQVIVHRTYSSAVAGEFEDGYFDWIYIDGDHRYEFVIQDLQLYYPKVKPGGYLIGDDYGNEGWWDNGVQKAVDKFVTQRPNLSVEVVGDQFIIRKSE